MEWRDADLDDDALWPRTWANPARSALPAFLAVHGAYHVLGRRMHLETREIGLAPSDVAVLATLHRGPDLTVGLVRQRTGLRPSTLDSLLDRLESRELVRRESPRSLRNEVILALTGPGGIAGRQAHEAVIEIELELGALIQRDTLAAADAIFEAARALGVPGTASDY